MTQHARHVRRDERLPSNSGDVYLWPDCPPPQGMDGSSLPDAGCPAGLNRNGVATDNPVSSTWTTGPGPVMGDFIITEQGKVIYL